MSTILLISMFDDRALSIKLDPRLPLVIFNEHLDKIKEFPERRYYQKYGSIWRVPITEPNVTYLRNTWQEDQISLDDEAAVFLRHSELTDKVATKRETRRWQYIFEDEVPEVSYVKDERSITVPYKHQTVALDAIHNVEFFGLFMEMGTGKTKVIVDEAFWQARLRIEQRAEGKNVAPYKVLIVCPKTIRQVWESEFRKHKDPKIPMWVSLIGTQTQGMDHILKGIRSKTALKVFITTYDRVHTMGAAFSKIGIDMMVCDESTKIKNPSARRTKSVLELAEHAKRRFVLSGAPVVNSIMDLFSQTEFLNPGTLGMSNYNAFKSRYLRVAKIAGKNYTKVTGYQRLDELKERLARYSFIVTKDQCLDLPDKVYSTRFVEMSKEQREIYDSLINLHMATLEDQDQPAMMVARAMIALLLRLAQVSSGFVVHTEGERREQAIPGGNGKMQALIEILEEVGKERPVLVWARFRYDINGIQSELERLGYRVASIYGGTTAGARDKAVQDFNSGNIDVLIGEPGTGGIGLTLLGPDDRQCNTVVYYSSDYSLEKRVQSEDRCHRIGQTNKVTYIDLVCENSVDEHIISRLQAKRDLSEEIKDVESIKAILLGEEYGINQPKGRKCALCERLVDSTVSEKFCTLHEVVEREKRQC